MANIRIPKAWEKIGINPIDEAQYNNRRAFIKQLGLGALGTLVSPYLMSQSKKNVAFPMQDGKAPSFDFEGMSDLYPAKRNKKYTLDRDLSDEYVATHNNNFYEFIKDQNIYTIYRFIHTFDTSNWTFEVDGLAEKTGTYHLEEMMKKFPLEERTYRFRCVERWAMAVPWTGIPLASFLATFEPKNSAKYVRFTTANKPNEMPGISKQPWYPWPYQEGLLMSEAMNELAFMATGIFGKPLPKQNGAPMRLVVPWKYGYKNIKSIVKITFTDSKPKTFWNELQSKEYPFISNVNPAEPHPRWSQEREYMIPNGDWIPTLPFNGYGEYVASLYQ